MPNHRPLNVIVEEIVADWGDKVHYTAKPYLRAMRQLHSINDYYFDDDAVGVVTRFLVNASTWRGVKAREIKAELKEILKDARKQVRR